MDVSDSVGSDIEDEVVDGGGERGWSRRILLAVLILAVVVVVSLAGKGLRDRFAQGRNVTVRSTVDGMPYAVFNSYSDQGRAANTLAEINRRVLTLMRHLKKKYTREGFTGNPDRARDVRRLLSRYNVDNIAENNPFDVDSAYSEDKGSLVAICLRDRQPRPGKDGQITHWDDGKIHNIDVLCFVTCHELTHVMLDAYDHPPVFWASFKWLLKEADECGMANFPDYAKTPEKYCGLLIDYSPLHDANAPCI